MGYSVKTVGGKPADSNRDVTVDLRDKTQINDVTLTTGGWTLVSGNTTIYDLQLKITRLHKAR